jgi:hypothetical protein
MVALAVARVSISSGKERERVMRDIPMIKEVCTE